MRARLVLVATLAGAAAAVHPSVAADPVPPACVVIDQEPVHAQVGYAPNGPADCTALP